MDLTVTWPQLKAFVTSKGLTIQYVDIGPYYVLLATSEPFKLNTVISKDSSADQVDFETNFKG